MDHPAYPRICAKDEDDECVLPFSFATLIYTTEETLITGDFEIGDSCAPLIYYIYFRTDRENLNVWLYFLGLI